jgi:hypothetical protein
LKDVVDKKGEIKEAMEQTAKTIKEHAKNIPKTIFHASTEFRDYLEQLDTTVDKYLTKASVVEPYVYQIAFSGQLGLDTKIVKDASQKAFIRKIVRDNAKFINMKLVYRGSRDGFQTSKFHELCDKYEHTLTICKSKTYDKIWGGYADKKWNTQNGYVQSDKTFIFSVSEKTVCKLKGTSNQNAMYCNTSYLPTFGGGFDFYLANGCDSNSSSYSNLNHTYELPSGANSQSYLAGAYNYSLSELEVYSLQR